MKCNNSTQERTEKKLKKLWKTSSNHRDAKHVQKTMAVRVMEVLWKKQQSDRTQLVRRLKLKKQSHHIRQSQSQQQQQQVPNWNRIWKRRNPRIRRLLRLQSYRWAPQRQSRFNKCSRNPCEKTRMISQEPARDKSLRKSAKHRLGISNRTTSRNSCFKERLTISCLRDSKFIGNNEKTVRLLRPACSHQPTWNDSNQHCSSTSWLLPEMTTQRKQWSNDPFR